MLPLPTDRLLKFGSAIKDVNLITWCKSILHDLVSSDLFLKFYIKDVHTIRRKNLLRIVQGDTETFDPLYLCFYFINRFIIVFDSQLVRISGLAW